MKKDSSMFKELLSFSDKHLEKLKLTTVCSEIRNLFKGQIQNSLKYFKIIVIILHMGTKKKKK